MAAVPCESPRLVTRALGARLTADIVPARGDIAATHGCSHPQLHVFLFLSSKINRLQTLRSVTLSSKTANPKNAETGCRRATCAERTWLEAQHCPKRVPRARLVTYVPCRPRTRARGTPIGRPAARHPAQSARSYPRLMRHRRASPTAPVRDSSHEWPDRARPAVPCAQKSRRAA